MKEVIILDLTGVIIPIRNQIDTGKKCKCTQNMIEFEILLQGAKVTRWHRIRSCGNKDCDYYEKLD